MPNCFRLFTHWFLRAASRAACTAGSVIDASTAIIRITTNSSISVKPARFTVVSRLPAGAIRGDRERMDLPFSLLAIVTVDGQDKHDSSTDGGAGGAGV